jgi:hypothetical protein
MQEIDSFLDCFKSLKDPRSERNRFYSMAEILLVVLCAAICGAQGWQDVENFGKVKIDFLRRYLSYDRGIPSDDTFRRFFRALDPDHFQHLFREWIQALQRVLPSASEAQEEEKVVAIDGKSSRRSFDDDTKMLHMVSAYATDARLVLAQEKVSEKSNEITAIPQLLQWLDLKGSTVTIDAMGCQYAIANQIIDKEGQYIFSLKGNQGTLSEDVKTYFADNQIYQTLAPCEEWDKGHGRIESRTCWVATDVVWLRQRHPQWHSIGCIIRIDSTRQIKEKVTKETRYYIGSKTETPEKALKKIRSHWAIENSLHWVLDMSFGEDQSRIRKENAPQVMAIVRHMALNLLQMQKKQTPRQSIRALRMMAGWDDALLASTLSQKFS